MKFLSVSIVLASVGLMTGEVKSMMELTPAHVASVDAYPGEQLNYLGLAIKGKSIAAIDAVLKDNKDLASQEVEVGIEMLPLEFAFFLYGHDEEFMLKVFERLKQEDIEINQYKNFSVLHYAAGHGHLKLFKDLLEAGASIDSLTQDRASIIHCAVGMYPDMQSQNAAFHRKKDLDLNSPNTKKLIRSNSSLKKILELEINRLNPDEDEKLSLTPQRTLLNRLEILKILLINQQATYCQDQFGKMPQDYAMHEKLKTFLNGITGNEDSDISLYEQIKGVLAEECLSPRSPRTQQSPGRSCLGASS